MAETVVSFAVQRLGELLISEIKHLHGLRDKVKMIQLELRRMQCFLEEADKKQNQDKRVKQWVAEIRELAFRIEDVIETFAMKFATKNQKSGFTKMLQRFAYLLSEGVSRHNISSEIDALKDEITSLTTSLQTYGITKGLQEGEASNSTSTRIFYSHIVEKDFVGMKKELEQLISSLKKKEKGCEVVSICGMGGQGKTTLAQKLYNHTEIKAHFKKIAWVCITQQFNLEKVLKEVLKQLIPERKTEVTTMDNGELFKELYKVQNENNCLVVLDDIWTLNSWRRLKHAFPVGETSSVSKILVTTRNKTVAEIGHVHKIEGLTTQEGWQLLSKKAGIHDRSSDSTVVSQMERIGKNMVEKCKHLPLAISTIGGILTGKSLREWEMINKDVSFYLGEGEGVTKDDEYYTVRQVLGLSYDGLPSRLRQCFLCFANFEEDEEINTEELYILWIAEGLISREHKAEGKMSFDVAENLLDELARRSLVEVEKNEDKEISWSKYITCRVHDLIRDLCLSKAKEEKFIKVIHLETESEHESRASIARRLCIYPFGESMLEPCDKDMISHVRSLFVGRSFSSLWPDKILSLQKLKLLRILKVQGFQFTKQEMRTITKLVYLKCLSLRECNLKELPSSISNLRNLEILDLAGSKCDGGIVANVLWKLKHLKYLYFPDEFQVVERLRLEELDELEVIHHTEPFYCSTYELIRLRKLKILSGTFYMVDDEYQIKRFLDFVKSRKLHCSDLIIRSGGDGLCLVSWLECCFINVLLISGPLRRLLKEYGTTSFSSSCLSELKLWSSEMEEDPMTLLEKLPNLRKLHLSTSYVGTEMVCTAHGFPKLQFLSLEFLIRLKQWWVEEKAMPNLSSLKIKFCSKLEMLPEGLRYLAALKTLEIRGMSDAFKERIDGINGAEGVDMYKISHVPNLNFSRE